MSFYLVIYSQCTPGYPAIMRRSRLPGTYATPASAAAAGLEHLKQHPLTLGFEVEPVGLQAANDAALNARTIYRAQVAREVRRMRKAMEIWPPAKKG